MHEPKDPQRKETCRRSFRSFCESYFPQTFHLAWSPDHLKVIGKIEAAVLEGGLFAMAMPRGSGKTSLCEVACLWALVYGHREFVALIGSDEDHAADMLDSIKSELENNDLLEEDYNPCSRCRRMLLPAGSSPSQAGSLNRSRWAWCSLNRHRHSYSCRSSSHLPESKRAKARLKRSWGLSLFRAMALSNRVIARGKFPYRTWD